MTVDSPEIASSKVTSTRRNPGVEGCATQRIGPDGLSEPFRPFPVGEFESVGVRGDAAGEVEAHVEGGTLRRRRGVDVERGSEGREHTDRGVRRQQDPGGVGEIDADARVARAR